MPERPVVYEDVEVQESDGLGLMCVIGGARVFVGKYVPLAGSVRRKGDKGSLTLPRWFAEQQGLPLDHHLNDAEVEEWFMRARLTANAAQEYAESHPGDVDAQATLDRAMTELASAMLLKARRQGEPR